MKLFKATYKSPSGKEFTVISQSEDDCVDNDVRIVAAEAFNCHVGQLSKRKAQRTNARILKNPNIQEVKKFKSGTAWII